MPLFEYSCRACGRNFETIVRGSARPACPSCNGRDLEKRLSTFAVSVRGASRAAAPPAGGAGGAGGGGCGSCGDPRGPGSCDLD